MSEGRTDRLPPLYVVCFDMESEFLPTFLAWYARKHAPEVIGVGFWSARSYEALDADQALWDVYEIPDTNIFDGPRYQSMSNSDAGVEEALSHISNRSVTLYDQVGVAESAQALPRFGGRVLSAVRFEVDLPAAEVVERYESEYLRALRGRDGVVSGRLCQRSPRQHPWWPSNEPEWCGVVEWVSEEAAQATYHREAASEAHESLFGDGLSRLSYNLIRRHYGLVREDASEAHSSLDVIPTMYSGHDAEENR